MKMSTGSSDVTAELEHLILSCYGNDSDEELNSGPVKDIGRHISVEARAYFSSLGMSSCSDDKSKVDLSLKYIAILMQRLGSGSLVATTDDTKKPRSIVDKQRIKALNCLTGALYGCSDLWYPLQSKEVYKSLAARSSTADLIEKIGGFVLLFCAPMQADDGDDKQAWTEDDMLNDENGLKDVAPSMCEDVRDAAMDCSCALLKLPWIPSVMPSDPTQPKEDQTLLRQLELMIHVRIQMARQAVQYRCSSIEYAKQPSLEKKYNNNHGYEDYYEDEESVDSNDGVNATLSGLSLLVRARRSLCFSVLQSAVDGIHYDLEMYRILALKQTPETNISAQTVPVHPDKAAFLNHAALEELVSFISFTSTCLLGETDPRCLMQMMTLLHKCQTSFYPLFSLHGHPSLVHKNNSSVSPTSSIQFPTGELFDAVAPYYPIQFTPPPNNIHGISRDGLHRAFISVVCYFDRSYPIEYFEDTTANLAAKLFLERVFSSSPSGSNDKALDDSEATNESIQGLGDLSQLLFQTMEATSVTNLDESSLLQYPRWFFLSEETLTDLSSTLFSCHEKASILFNQQVQSEDSEKDQNRLLADRCRETVARIAHDIDFYYQMVISSNTDRVSTMDHKVKYLWRVFISDLIISCTNTISSNIKGRVALAYLASLAACGGIQTLRMALSHCIPVLLRILSVYESINDAQVTCDYELMSSAAYGLAALFSSSKKTIAYIQKDGLSLRPHPLESCFVDVILVLCKIAATHSSNTTLLQIANIKALEAILLCTPSYLLIPTVTSSIKDILLRLTEKAVNESEIEDNDDLNTAISHFLGTLIGKSFSTSSAVIGAPHTNNEENCCIFEDQEIALYAQTKVLPEIMSSCLRKQSLKSKIIRNILSDACSMGPVSASTAIFSHIMDALGFALHTSIKAASLTDDDDEYCVSLSMTLSHIVRHGGEATRSAFCSLSPPHSTVFNLIDVMAQPTADSDPGMSSLLLPSKQDDLRLIVNKRIDLVSRITSCILTAYLYAVPSNHFEQLVSYSSRILPPLTEWDNIKLFVVIPILATSLTRSVYEGANNLLEMLPYLVEYCLNADNHSNTRTHAASLAFAIIERLSRHEDICPARKILVDLLYPCFTKCYELHVERADNAFDEFSNVLSLISLLGAASIARGHSSLQTADEVGLFLAKLSCHAQITASSATESCDLPFESINSTASHRVRFAAARAYGSLLNWERRQIASPMTKQRLAHVTAPVILSTFGIINKADFLFPLTMLAHISCNVPMKAFPQSQIDRIFSLILQGLGILADQNHIHDIELRLPSPQKTDVASLGQLILCAILKITIESEVCIPPFLPNLISSLLLYCAIYSNDVEQTPNLIIVLQLLMNFVHMQREEFSSYCKTSKDKVLLHLSPLIFHPSLQVRQATAQVRNVWALL